MQPESVQRFICFKQGQVGLPAICQPENDNIPFCTNNLLSFFTVKNVYASGCYVYPNFKLHSAVVCFGCILVCAECVAGDCSAVCLQRL